MYSLKKKSEYRWNVYVYVCVFYQGSPDKSGECAYKEQTTLTLLAVDTDDYSTSKSKIITQQI